MKCESSVSVKVDVGLVLSHPHFPFSLGYSPSTKFGDWVMEILKQEDGSELF